MQQQQIQDTAATVSSAAAGASWLSHLAAFNEIVTALAGLVALVSGVWVLIDKNRARLERKRNGHKQSDRPEGGETSTRREDSQS